MRKLLYFLVLLVSLSFVAAEDVAYILEDGTPLNQNILDAFNDLGFSYKVVRDNQITSEDFSQFGLLLVTEDVNKRSSIPFEDVHAIFFDERIAEEVWANAEASLTSSARDIKVVEEDHEIFEGVTIPLDGEIDIYPARGAEMHFLRITPSYVNALAIRTSGIRPVMAYSIRDFGGVAVKDLFFGLIEPTEWNVNARTIFENSLLWIMSDIDQDGDGFIFEDDCDDNDASVFPGATELPYDDVDQDCDGFDLIDVDNDGYCSEGFLIEDVSQCSLESGSFGTDCDDDNPGINVEAIEIMDNIDQNCVNDAPELISNIPDLSWDEDTNLQVDMSLYFADPEGDVLDYDLDLSITNIALTFLGDIVTLTPDPDYFGVQNGYFLVDDGDLQISSNEVEFEVKDTFDPDVTPPIVELIAPADESFFDVDEVPFTFTGSDETASILTCSYYSDITGVFEQLEGNEFTINSGQEKTIFVGTNNGIPDGTFRWNMECDDGSNKAFAPNDWTFTVDEDDAPVFNMETEYSVDENELLTIVAVAEDPDGLPISYSIDDPRFAQNDDTFTWTPNYDEAGEYSFTITAKDGTLETDLEVHVVVNNVNRAPVFTENIINQNTDEDVEFELDLKDYFSDPDVEDTLTYSHLDGEHLDVSFDGSVVTIAPEENWNGNTTIIFVASDSKDSTSSNEVTVFVQSKNDPPVLDPISDIIVDEGDLVTITANANDVDSVGLEYSINSDKFHKEPGSNVFTWQTGILDADEYSFVVTVSDGSDSDETTVIVVVNDKNVDPVLDPIDDITIDEDSGQTEDIRILIAHDEDGPDEDLEFLVQSKGRSGCSIDGDKLSVKPDENFFGNTKCVVRVRDEKNGADEQDVNVIVNGVDDPLKLSRVFPDASEVRMGLSDNQNFFIEYEDVDNDPVTVKWFKDDGLVSQKSTYTFFSEGIEKAYEIKVEVSDGVATTVTNNWDLIVEDSFSGGGQSCSDLGGFTCQVDEICNGDLLDADDVAICCSTSCDSPVDEEILENKNACESGIIGDLDITIKDPDDDDEFAPKAIMDVEVKVENEGDEDLDEVIVEAFLMVRDFTAGNFDELDDAESEETDIDEDEDELFELELEVPDGDLDEDDDYVLFVKAYEDGHEDEQCVEEMIDIDVERENHDVLIEEFKIISEEVSCGGQVRAKVDLENLGKKEEEDMYFILKVPQLNLEERSSLFTLEEFDEDNKISRSASLKIPDEVEAGSYRVVLEAVFDDGAKSTSKEKEIIINTCKPKEVEVVKSFETNVELESLFEVDRGRSILFPIEVKNTGDKFTEYQVVIQNSGLIEPQTRNILIGPNQEKIVNVESSIREDAPFGEHRIDIQVMSEGRLMDGKEIFVKVRQPEEVEKSQSIYTLSLMNLLGLVILIYLFSLLFK